MKTYKVDVSYTMEIKANNFNEATRIAANTYRRVNKVDNLRIGKTGSYEDINEDESYASIDDTVVRWFEDEQYDDLLNDEEGENGAL